MNAAGDGNVVPSAQSRPAGCSDTPGRGGAPNPPDWLAVLVAFALIAVAVAAAAALVVVVGPAGMVVVWTAAAVAGCGSWW